MQELIAWFGTVVLSISVIGAYIESWRGIYGGWGLLTPWIIGEIIYTIGMYGVSDAVWLKSILNIILLYDMMRRKWSDQRNKGYIDE